MKDYLEEYMNQPDEKLIVEIGAKVASLSRLQRERFGHQKGMENTMRTLGSIAGEQLERGYTRVSRRRCLHEFMLGVGFKLKAGRKEDET